MDRTHVDLSLNNQKVLLTLYQCYSNKNNMESKISSTSLQKHSNLCLEEIVIITFPRKK